MTVAKPCVTFHLHVGHEEWCGLSRRANLALDMYWRQENERLPGQQDEEQPGWVNLRKGTKRCEEALRSGLAAQETTGRTRLHRSKSCCSVRSCVGRQPTQSQIEIQVICQRYTVPGPLNTSPMMGVLL